MRGPCYGRDGSPGLGGNCHSGYQVPLYTKQLSNGEHSLKLRRSDTHKGQDAQSQTAVTGEDKGKTEVLGQSYRGC
ncbi:hypothetical protein Q5P01_014635 [Channa striata]|uniref:Uncharacterized protein n=1 Tax=Channa striata TaxID=64152 RepID=A0AA88MIS3_CHASR|nr:hypothetical protein Q5P01_014635 [Channa striata]